MVTGVLVPTTLKSTRNSAQQRRAAEFGIHAVSPCLRRDAPTFGKLKLMHGPFSVATCGDGYADPLGG